LLIDGIRFNEGLSIFIAGGYTGRLIFGDIISSKKRDNRKRYLGIDKKMLHGVEIMFGFHFENLIIDFQIPYVITGDVPGLSHGQFITSIRFVGGVSIFNKKLFNRRVSPLKMVE
jgi:hypothetical protein